MTAEYKRVMEARRAAGKEVAHISPHLPTSPHISPHLPAYLHASPSIPPPHPYSKKLTSLTIGTWGAGYPPAQAMPEAGPEKPAHAKGGVDSDAEPAAAGTQAGSRTS